MIQATASEVSSAPTGDATVVGTNGGGGRHMTLRLDNPVCLFRGKKADPDGRVIRNLNGGLDC